MFFNIIAVVKQKPRFFTSRGSAYLIKKEFLKKCFLKFVFLTHPDRDGLIARIQLTSINKKVVFLFVFLRL